MPIELEEHAVEGSSYRAHVAFTDDYGSSVVPETLKWSLFDKTGAVINSRDDVTVVSGLAEQMDIILSGADLPASAGNRDYVMIYLVVEITYDGASGTGLPLVEEFRIRVYNVVGD